MNQQVICIAIEHVYPPIPTREFDWCAYDDNRADVDMPGDAYAYGPTREIAVERLLEQQEEEVPCCPCCEKPHQFGEVCLSCEPDIQAAVEAYGL